MPFVDFPSPGSCERDPLQQKDPQMPCKSRRAFALGVLDLLLEFDQRVANTAKDDYKCYPQRRLFYPKSDEDDCLGLGSPCILQTEAPRASEEALG